MLSLVVHVSLKVPLSCHIVGALLGRLVIRLQQKVPDPLQIHLVEPVIDVVSVPSPVEIVRIRPNVVWIIPRKIWIIPPKIRIIVNINSVISIGLIVRPQGGTGVSSISII